MRTVVADQYEFDHPDAEERVEISISRRSRYCPDVVLFAALVVGADRPLNRTLSPQDALRASRTMPAPKPFYELFGRNEVASHLAKFAGVSVPDRCTWECYSFDEGSDAQRVIIDARDEFIGYHWSSTA